MVDARDNRIAALKGMLAENPGDPFALYGLALEYKALGRNEDAIILLKKALGGENPEVYIYYQLGELFYDLDDIESALDALDSGLEYAAQLNHQKALGEIQGLRDQIADDLD